jgi:AAA ATPase domain
MTLPIADYEGPRLAFDALFQPVCNCRILLLCGPSGTGKTRLLEHCRARTPPGVALVPVDLRGSTTGVAEIFSRFGFALTWSLLTNFTARVSALEGGGATRIVVDRNWQVGFNNRISVVLHTGDEASRGQRRTELTDALFEDLAQIGRPVLMLFDTFEHAPSEVQEWLSGPFLARAAQTTAVRVVIAGQKVPKSNTIDWGYCCALHDLHGVRDAQHWLPVVREMHRRIPKPPEETYMAAICDALQGNPLAIMNWIEALDSEVSVV